MQYHVAKGTFDKYEIVSTWEHKILALVMRDNANRAAGIREHIVLADKDEKLSLVDE